MAHKEDMTEGFQKIFFRLDPNSWHLSGSESLWGEPLGDSQRGLFRLRNSPFFVKGISFWDIVYATLQADGIAPDFCNVIDRGGHSTYRILSPQINSEFDEYWSRLEHIGCTYESTITNRGKLYAVDVPPTANIFDVYSILDKAERLGVWIFEEGHVGHPLDK